MLLNEAQINQDIKLVEGRFEEAISSLRVGRPSLKVFENIFVDYYGASTAVSFMGSPSQNGLSIAWKIFDKGMTSKVLEAIESAQLGASVKQSDSQTINVNFIPMTGEVREQQVKELYRLLEDARVAVRQNVRRKYMEELDKMDKVPEDEKKRSEERVQELVDSAIKNLEEIAEMKKLEIEEVK